MARYAHSVDSLTAPDRSWPRRIGQIDRRRVQVEVAAGEHVLLEGAHQGPGVLLELGHQRDLADARQVHPDPLQLSLQPVVGLVLTEVHRRDVRDDARVHPRARQHVLRPGPVDRGRLGRAREHRACDRTA